MSQAASASIQPNFQTPNVVPIFPAPNSISLPLARFKVVVNTTIAKGGKSSESEVVQVNNIGGAQDTYRKSVEHVDNVAACKAVDRAVAIVRKAISRHTTYTPIGYLVPEDRVPDLEAALQKAYAACHTANNESFLLGSARRVSPGIVYLTPDLADPSVARHVYDRIVERLQAIMDYLITGDPNEAGHLKPELENIVDLACGVQRRALAMCLPVIPVALADRRKGDVPNLEAFRAAARMFTR